MLTKHSTTGKRAGAMRQTVLIGRVLTFGILLVLLMTVPVIATHDSIPVAVIDGTMKVAAGQTVYLDGTFSSDPGGGPLSFRWTLESLPGGSIATITGEAAAQAQFNADVAGIYRVKLVVNNGFNDSQPVYATITVTP